MSNQTKFQFYTDPVPAAIIQTTLQQYPKMKKTDVFTRLLILGIQVINDLDVDLSNEIEVGQVGICKLKVGWEDYSAEDAISDLASDIREFTYVPNTANDEMGNRDELPW